MWFAIVTVLVFGPALWADEPKDKDKKDDQKPPSVAEQVRALRAEVQKAQQQIVTKYREAKTDEERQTVITVYTNKPQEYVGKFLDLAKKNPTDNASFDALTFVVSNAPAGAVGDEAVGLILENHLDKVTVQVCQGLSRANSPAAAKLLEGVLEKSKDHQIQANACLCLAQNLKNRSEAPGVKRAEAEKLNKQAESFFEQVEKKFADVGKLAEQAKKELFEVRFLAIGKTVPEIEGEDVDGKKFKLSDYRGKVVLLDFWGNW
jgi:hypothetical protein